MILGRGLTMTGAMEPDVRLLGRIWSWNKSIGLLLTLVIAGVAGGFVTTRPCSSSCCRCCSAAPNAPNIPRRRHSCGMNFAILAGGMLTSVGTSTNLLVLSIAADLGMTPMGLFDFTGIAALSFAMALPYLWLVAPRLLPEIAPVQNDAARDFEAKIVVEPDNARLVEKTLAELEKTLGRPVPISGLLRNDQNTPARQGHRARAGRRAGRARHPRGVERPGDHVSSRPVRSSRPWPLAEGW